MTGDNEDVVKTVALFKSSDKISPSFPERDMCWLFNRGWYSETQHPLQRTTNVISTQYTTGVAAVLKNFVVGFFSAQQKKGMRGSV